MKALADHRPTRYNLRTMLRDAKIEAYRKMTQEERWREVEQLMTFAWNFLQHLPPEEVARRLAHEKQQHVEADAIILAHLARFP